MRWCRIVVTRLAIFCSGDREHSHAGSQRPIACRTAKIIGRTGAPAAGLDRGPVDRLHHTRPFEEDLNDFVDLGLNFRYFFVPKTMFVKYAQAFCVLPGDYVTLDELLKALTRVQTGKVPQFPAVLLGSDQRQGSVDWVRAQFVGSGRIDPQDLEVFDVTDDFTDAVTHLSERLTGAT